MSQQRKAKPAPWKEGIVLASAVESPFNAVLDARIFDAILRGQGNMKTTLEILGYKVDQMDEIQIRRESEKLAARPGVRKFGETTLLEIEESKDMILRRQLAIALYGDPGPALQAGYFLAEIMGWRAPKKLETNNLSKTVTYTAVLQDDRLIEAAKKLNHEPGEAIAISSEAVEESEDDGE